MNCPRCGKPAYVGYTEVKCTNTKCVHFDQREADDFAARKTLPPKSTPKCVGCFFLAPCHKAGCPYLPARPPVAGPLTGFAPPGTPAPWGTPQGTFGYFSTGLPQCPDCKRTPSEYYINPFGTPKCPQCGYTYTPPLGPAKLTAPCSAVAIATGHTLDAWGGVLSTARRPGETDDMYRARLRSLLP